MRRPLPIPRSLPRRAPVALLVLIACTVWATWTVLAEMSRRWSSDPTYSHGYLVPLAALLILWARRDRMPAAVATPCWWGLGLVALGVAMQSLGAFYYVRWLSGAAMLAYLAGAAAMIGGRPGLRWAAPAIGFLVFMIPLPHRFDVLMHQPLRRVSSMASGCALEMLGIPAIVEGNVIHLDGVELGVVDACSGLKMFILFVGLSTAIALLARHRTLGERVLIVLSAAPIAILCNVIRITLTGVMHEVASPELANLVFHDLAGWLMMPMALGLLWIELWLLSILFVEAEAAPRRAFRLAEAVPATGTPRGAR